MEIKKFPDNNLTHQLDGEKIRKPYLFIKTTKEVWEVVQETYSDLENSTLIFNLKSKL